MIQFNDRVLDPSDVEFLRDVLEIFISEYDDLSRWDDDVKLAKSLLNECH